jgi:hypothetical protein
MATDIFPAGAVYELGDPSGNPIDTFGYGWAEAGGGYGYQTQRWILFSRNRKVDFPPGRRVILKKTADATWSAPKSTKDFTDLVRAKFDPAKDYYVKVNCERRTGIASLPRPMPKLDYLKPDPVTLNQPDVGTSQLFTGSSVVGYVQTFSTDKYRYHEYWVLFNGYSAALAPQMGTIVAPEHFADLMDKKSWNLSATLVTCANGYYEKLPAIADM